MQIRFSPVRRDDVLKVVRSGDILTINGERFDFSGLPDGGTLPAGEVPCEWITGPVERVGGSLHLSLVIPHGPTPSQAVAFPAPLIDPPEGPLAIPADPQEVEHVEG